MSDWRLTYGGKLDRTGDREHPMFLRLEGPAGEVYQVDTGVPGAVLQGMVDAVGTVGIERALLLRTIQHVEATVREGELPDPEFPVVGQPPRFGWYPDGMRDGADLRTVAVKACRWQDDLDGDLYCRASSDADGAVIGAAGRHAIAPTDGATCAACDIPDEREVCSSFTHPDVRERGTIGGRGHLRHLMTARCAAGQDRPGTDCHPLGKECWHRTITVQPRNLAGRATALGLVEALDVIDVHLKAALGHRYVKSGGFLTVGLLTQRPTDRDSFQTAASALTDVLDRFQVPAGEVQQAGADPNTTKGWARLQAVIEHAATDGGAAVDIDNAIAVLDNARQLRNSQQHTQRGDAVIRARTLGLAWPPDDWGDAWDQVAGQVRDALVRIRDALRTIVDTQP